MHHVDADAAGVRWEADLPLDAVGPWTWTVRCVGRPGRVLAEEISRKVGRRPGGPRQRAGSRAPRLLSAAARRATGSGPVPRWPTRPPRSPTAGADARPRRRGRSIPRWPRSATAPRPLRPPVRRSPARSCRSIRLLARFGAWYELFPRSWGGLDGVRRRLPALAELGFDVIYLPPIHPIGRTNRKGRNNALVAGPDDPGSPWAIGDATGGHTAVHADLGTIDDVEALVADARSPRPGDRPRLRHPVLGRPPLAHRAPRVVLPPARRHPQVRREPAQEVPGHLQRRLRLRGLAGRSGTALLDVVRSWVDRGVRVFRVDNPHTKPLAVLGVADRVDPRHAPRGDLPRRGVHEAHDDAGAGRRSASSQSYTYFTWKSSRLGAHRVRRPSCSAPGEQRLLPPELLREHAGHPHRGAPARRAHQVRQPPDPGGHALAELRHLLGLRELRARGRAARLRGVPRLREVRG